MKNFKILNFNFPSVYDDVKPAFERWLKHDKNIYIYSSGSVPAQILLFSNSDYGNMTKVVNNNIIYKY